MSSLLLKAGLVSFNSAGQPVALQLSLGLVPMTVSLVSFQPSPSLSQGTLTAMDAGRVTSGGAGRLSRPR
jgi:hypothetical protein